MEIGNKVEQIVPVITGEIVDTTYDKEAKCLKHLVQYVTASGPQTRWFHEEELEVVL